MIIVGLGNPGSNYQSNRHNIGFMAIDYLAERHKVSFRGKFQALVGETNLGETRAVLVKPQTYMNLSGRSVREILNWYKLGPENVLIVYDDMDLPLGRLRIRPQGGPGGHNGIKSLISELGTEVFSRIKVGIGRPPLGWDPADYVLGNFTANESNQVKEIMPEIASGVEELVERGLLSAMNKFNR